MRIVSLLIGLATVLPVKDTGKSRERVKPVELKYGVPDPLECLKSDLPSMVQAKICSYYENELRAKAEKK